MKPKHLISLIKKKREFFHAVQFHHFDINGKR